MPKSRTPILLDTHAWIWCANGDLRIKASVRDLFAEAAENETFFLAAISLWELAMLEARGRLVLGMAALEWVKTSLDQMRLRIVDLTPEIAIESTDLPGSFHGDPADRLIVASARVLGAKLVSANKNIVRYGREKHVQVVKL